jgi:hypothetical protein
MMDSEKEIDVEYFMGPDGGNGGPSPISVVILSKSPVKKAITKRYPDGRTLTLVVNDDKLVEKMMTFRWGWDYKTVREEKEKGATVSFKYWVKGGLDVGLSYFGTYLFGKTIAIDYSKVMNTTFVAEDWRAEVSNDIAFPLVDVKKIKLESGFSADEKENPFMQSLMHDMVLDALFKNDAKKTSVGNFEAANIESDKCCDFCGYSPCVWIAERRAVIANDNNENGHTFTIYNKTRRKMAYKHMYRVVNGPGQKGIRHKLPECVELGVRTLFPDEQAQYMGFKEE